MRLGFTVPEFLLNAEGPFGAAAQVCVTFSRMHNRSALIIFTVSLFLVPFHDASAADYAGVWKRKCEDYFGLLIRHADASTYSIVFCGVDGCYKPGEYAPNSAIEGDPAYVVQSADALGVKWKNGKGMFTYKRCSKDTAWDANEAKKILQSRPPAAATAGTK